MNTSAMTNFRGSYMLKSQNFQWETLNFYPRIGYSRNYTEAIFVANDYIFRLTKSHDSVRYGTGLAA